MEASLFPIVGALATTAAAFIAAVIALVNMLNSKDQKTTEFRQAWINSLRQNISDFSAQARWISAAVEQAKRFDPNCYSRDSKAYDSYAENRERMSAAYYSICLHFKPNDRDFRSIDACMKNVFEALAKPSTLEFKTVIILLEKLVNESRSVLKREWTRVKSGEWTYRVTKYAAMFVIVSSTLGAAYLFRTFSSVLNFRNESVLLQPLKANPKPVSLQPTNPPIPNSKPQ